MILILVSEISHSNEDSIPEPSKWHFGDKVVITPTNEESVEKKETIQFAKDSWMYDIRSNYMDTAETDTLAASLKIRQF